MPLDIYQTVTDRILEMLDKGTVPWRQPIRNAGGGWPRNIESGRPYRGINVFLLSMTAWVQGYTSSYWTTFRQVDKAGGHVRKGEKSTMVVFWKKLEVKDEKTGEPKQIPVLRYYNVFNAEQCDDLKAPDVPSEPVEPFDPIEEAESIVTDYPDRPMLEFKGKQACYLPKDDLVRMPKPEQFLCREFFYATMFHELAHSTGHSTRLNRQLDARLPAFGSPDYSREELIAEMGSAFLCATAGISPQTIEQSAAYIAGWRKRLAADPKVVVMAAGAGQRAADWILGQRGEPTADAPDTPASPAVAGVSAPHV